MPADDPRKQAEIDYPRAAGEEGRAWIRSKPFGQRPQRATLFAVPREQQIDSVPLRADRR